MPRFFIDDINDERAIITGSDANHIGRSLRMKVGEEITLTKAGYDYDCVIESFTAETVYCKVISKEKNSSEPTINLTLYQALPKSDKMELIIQKAVELGATKIVPVLTQRCISRPDNKSFKKKIERFQKISLEAAKQSGRGIIPEIGDLINLKEAIKLTKFDDTSFICYECGGESLLDVNLKEFKNISLFIGSEGGFEKSEVDFCKDNGVIPIWLGNRILRCETAPLAAISIIMNLTHNM